MSTSLLSITEIATGIVMLIVSSFLLTLTIEEIGRRGKFSERFTGAIISPIFTAMPELVVIILALILVGEESGSQIAAGTIIGEPFMVSALGFPAVAITLLLAGRKKEIESVDPVLSKMLILMGLIFPIMVIPHFFNYISVRLIVLVLLVSLYFVFFKFVRGEKNFEEEATDIRFRSGALLILIIFVGVALLLGGSVALVRGIDSLSIQTGLNQELITILLVPIGTIVPETTNAVIWASRNKTSLAIGAMVGEEIFFVTFFPALGIIASQWTITQDGLLAIILTSTFSVVLGILSYKFRNAVYIFIFYLASLIIFLLFIY